MALICSSCSSVKSRLAKGSYPLSNFFSLFDPLARLLFTLLAANRIELLRHVLGTAAATTPQVKEEFDAGVTLGRVPETDLNWLTILSLSADEEVFPPDTFPP